MLNKRCSAEIISSLTIHAENNVLHGGGERCAQGSGGETGGKETTGETQM